MTDEILDVALLAFESGDDAVRRAVVDGVMRSLETGFVYTTHDMGEGFLDEAYGYLAEFFGREADEKDRFRAPGSMGQTGYTGLLGMNVEGIPYAHSPWAFWGVVAFCILVGLAVLGWFGMRNWLRR